MWNGTLGRETFYLRREKNRNKSEFCSKFVIFCLFEKIFGIFINSAQKVSRNSRSLDLILARIFMFEHTPRSSIVFATITNY